MADRSTSLTAFEPLIAALFSAFVASDGPRAKAVLPAGRRAELVELLTRLAADPDLLEDYLAAWKARRAALGRDQELRLLGADSPDVPWQQIAERGFAGLPDDVLADLATSPEALEAFDEEHLRGDGDLGLWFYDAVSRYSPGPRAAAAGPPAQAAVPSATARAARPRRGSPILVGLGIAAALLVGFLGGQIFRGGEGAGRPTAIVASAAVGPLTERGPNEQTRQIRVSSSHDGFVVVIELAADRKQQVTPGVGQGDFPVAKGGQTDEIRLRDDTTVVVYAITETPAGEPVRLGLDAKNGRRYLADQAADVQRDLDALLKRKGYRNFSVNQLTVPTPP